MQCGSGVEAVSRRRTAKLNPLLYEPCGRSLMQSVLSQFQNFKVAGRHAPFGASVGQRWIFRSNSGYLGREKLTDCAVLWISAALLVTGVGILINAGLLPSQSHSPGRWSTTFGTITSVRVVERDYGDETRWVPEVTYQYS